MYNFSQIYWRLLEKCQQLRRLLSTLLRFSMGIQQRLWSTKTCGSMTRAATVFIVPVLSFARVFYQGKDSKQVHEDG